MNRNHYLWTALLAASLFSPAVATAQLDPATNRLTFSARYGLNISAKFSGSAPIPVPGPARTTPNGAPYNYNNGYVYSDVSGSVDGSTWYWGYDSSSSQVDAGANTILLSRSTGPAALSSPEMKDDPSPGMELAFSHELGANRHFRFGFEGAINFTRISFSSHTSYALRAPGVTDAFPYTPDTTPPGATPANPYQGTFDGPGFLIGTSPASSTASENVVATVTGSRSLDADLWGGRLGYYLEYNLTDWLTMSLSGGFAVGWIDTSASWNESVAFTGGANLPPDSGSGKNDQWLAGCYAAANLNWQFTDHWYFTGGAQYQYLSNYEHSFGTRTVEIDLTKSVFISLGLSYSF